MRPSFVYTTHACDLRQADLLRLLSLCMEDKQDFAVWDEFLRRITPKVKEFIRGTLRQYVASAASLDGKVLVIGDMQENDLFQATVLRLVEDDCAALRRFSSPAENDLMAYLAVITRSVVRDAVRHASAKKRPLSLSVLRRSTSPEESAKAEAFRGKLATAEREVLAGEIRRISLQTLESQTGKFSSRDRLIFQLYFFHDLSCDQISRCRGINLSKGGVEKTLDRVKHRIRKVASIGISRATIQ